ncbi:membrane-spanning 4-domains subfamily A member 18-like [Pipistrellus kuhlii]|uniref:membrane-spanning 4-domains subfamily A member 18-like n=1 Tax=Pipistrellus kuhlii TaxID=59472 RepID=UPI00174F3FB5|nr:membrane-spanning 4-domains subfamily A member 18-like [Pipistrellus kuhlii]
MQGNQLSIKKETRVLGAIQIVSGLICLLLGIIWSYLRISHNFVFQNYIAVLSMAAYPFWATLIVTCTIAANILSASIAIIGLFLLIAEFIINLNPEASLYWPQRCGKILSQYLFLFITLEFIVACIVTHWSCQARRTR